MLNHTKSRQPRTLYDANQAATLSQVLRELPKIEKITLLEVVRRNADTIREKQAEGYTLDEIARVMKQHGYRISGPTLKVYLQRVEPEKVIDTGGMHPLDDLTRREEKKFEELKATARELDELNGRIPKAKKSVIDATKAKLDAISDELDAIDSENAKLNLPGIPTAPKLTKTALLELKAQIDAGKGIPDVKVRGMRRV